MVTFFEDLGGRIEEAWFKAHFREAAFAEICLGAFEATPPSKHVDVDGLLDWGLSCPRLPKQVDIASEFGEPPVTVFAGERFHISVYFWLDGTTDIHEHAFNGAFHVLEGGSLHSTFTFEQTDVINEHLLIGSLREKGIERLHRGDTRPIIARETIHSLFHLERPSATVVARTYVDPCSRPQYTYYRAGIALDPNYDRVESKRRRQLLQLVRRVRPNQALAGAASWARKADWVGGLLAMQYAASAVLSPDEGDELCALDEGHNAARAAVARELIASDRREAAIIRRRAAVTDPEQRFFLAVLLNVRGRENALRVIAGKYPQREPVESVMAWVRALARLPAVPFGGPGDRPRSVLGFPLDDVTEAVLRALLRGASQDALLRAISEIKKTTLDDEDRHQVLDLVAALRGSELFGYLLQ
jgi:hypothetical protein